MNAAIIKNNWRFGSDVSLSTEQSKSIVDLLFRDFYSIFHFLGWGAAWFTIGNQAALHPFSE